MKRVIIAAALIFVSGLISLYTKQNRVQNSIASVKVNFFTNQKDLASAD
jgi:cell division protein FtsL